MSKGIMVQINTILIEFMIIITCFFVKSSDCTLDDLIKTDYEATVGEAASPEKTFHLMSTGVSHIFWSHVMSTNFTGDEQVTEKCKRALSAVSDGLLEGDILPFHFVDASAKTPSGLIRATMSSFGDYDQCLAIHGTMESVEMKGKYCAVDFFPVRVGLSNDRKYTDDMTTGTLTFDRISVFKRIPFIFSLCIPHQCTDVDLRNILSTALSGHGLTVTGDINCDTKETASFDHRLRSLNQHQLVALYFIGTLTGLVVLSSLLHLYEKLSTQSSTVERYIFTATQPFSIFTAAKRVFWSRKQTWNAISFDLIKSFSIAGGVVGHVVLCADLGPLVVQMIDSHDNFSFAFSSFYTRFVIKEHGLVAVTALTGMATVLIAYPLIKQCKLNYFTALLDRLIRFLPGMAVFTALEFLWPLSGDGPLWSRAAKFGTWRCTNNWWRNLLFINNYHIDSNDLCGGASFYLSVDAHLFIIGLITMYCFSKHRKLGYLACFFFVAVSCSIQTYFAVKLDVTGSLCTVEPDFAKITQHFHYVHLATYSYVPAYLIGIVAGYLVVEHNLTVSFDGIASSIKYFLLASTFVGFANTLSYAHNLLHIIPQPLVFLVPILNRIALAAYSILSVLSMPTLLKYLFEKDQNTHQEKVDDDEETFNLGKGITRLTLPMFITNFLVIRFLYFSSRRTMSFDAVSVVTRIISFFSLVLIFSFLVQIFLLSPMECLRKRMIGGPAKTKKN